MDFLILVDQNVGQAVGVATRAYVLEEGRILSSGTPAELLGHPHIRSP